MSAWIAAADDVLRQAPWVTRQLDSRRAIVRLVAYLGRIRLVVRRGDGQLSRAGRPAAVAAADRVFSRQGAAVVDRNVRDQLAKLLRFELVVGAGTRFCPGRAGADRRTDGTGNRSLVARAADAPVVRLIGSIQPRPLVQWGHVCRRQLCGPVAGARLLSAAHCAKSPASLAVMELALRVHGCGDSDGVAIAAIHRLAGTEVQFLRDNPWDNAYEYVARLVWNALFPVTWHCSQSADMENTGHQKTCECQGAHGGNHTVSWHQRGDESGHRAKCDVRTHGRTLEIAEKPGDQESGESNGGCSTTAVHRGERAVPG